MTVLGAVFPHYRYRCSRSTLHFQQLISAANYLMTSRFDVITRLVSCTDYNYNIFRVLEFGTAVLRITRCSSPYLSKLLSNIKWLTFSGHSAYLYSNCYSTICKRLTRLRSLSPVALCGSVARYLIFCSVPTGTLTAADRADVPTQLLSSVIPPKMLSIIKGKSPIYL